MSPILDQQLPTQTIFHLMWSSACHVVMATGVTRGQLDHSLAHRLLVTALPAFVFSILQ
uniref:Uncharacterized protein n=1 Tax=Anguilla anguilla TaxID=7936 RepID=A0A0E9RYY7_ANGAN